MFPSKVVPVLAVIPEVLAAQAAGWRIHDMTRPRPSAVAPASSPVTAAPPTGAVVLFDGTGLSRWRGADGKPAGWTVARGYMQIRPGAGDLVTVDSFGDMQLHLEWAEPVPAKGHGQDRGNSGVFLMGRYELQVLDSYRNDTYPDGQAGAMYGQHPPLFNASRPPGEWQTYDVFFRRPRFDESGRIVAPARVTVLQNGIPVQDNVELFGPTSWLQRLPYEAHPDRLPLKLQDHGAPVRFRNIWVRPLPDAGPPPPLPPAVALPANALAPYLGRYRVGWGEATIDSARGRLLLDLGDGPMALSGESDSTFSIDGVDAAIGFLRDSTGAVTGFTMKIGGETWRYARS